ncbi:NAD(P)-dependent oxidoreductase [Arhodomonas sp. SL1]|uniref:NAD(P)-dependent oxidoreductase n=1 Tax=Arhodomonas sp. SL1 TaxID=3425691 RepID=UPI003F880E7C
MHGIEPANPAGGAVFLDAASLDRGDLDLTPLEDELPGLMYHPTTTPAELLERVGDAWCVVVNKVVLDAGFFAAFPALELVCIVATGTNNVDLEAAKRHGVTVVHCQGYGTRSLAQHVLALILMLARSIPAYTRDVEQGRWSASPHFCLLDHPILEIQGRRLGLVGHGAIGSEVARLAEAVGMEVVIAERPGAQPRPGRLAFDEVLESSDVLSLHCPLTDQTRGLIGKAELRRMRPGAYLVNTARGGIVDEGALLQALRDGEIAGAALDVIDGEPPPANHPLITAQLPNLLVTPHCAWGSLEARQAIVAQTAENIAAWRRGEPLRQVVAGAPR